MDNVIDRQRAAIVVSLKRWYRCLSRLEFPLTLFDQQVECIDDILRDSTKTHMKIEIKEKNDY
jgi:hypothetical protein